MTELTRPGEEGAGVGLGGWEKATFLEEERPCIQAKGLERPQTPGVVERNSVPLKAAVCICGSLGGGCLEK